MRLSTRDLFAFLTFFAVISWCAGRVGFDNPQFWIAAVISFTLAAFFIRWSGYRDGRTAALLAVTFFTGFCTLPFGLLASFFSALLLVLATLIGAAARITSTRVRSGVAMLMPSSLLKMPDAAACLGDASCRSPIESSAMNSDCSNRRGGRHLGGRRRARGLMADQHGAVGKSFGKIVTSATNFG